MLEKGVNSYLSVEEACELISDIDNSELWSGLDEETKSKYLMLAAVHIDSLTFTSRRHSAEQKMQFPRGNCTEIPRAVQLAQVLEALALSDAQSAQRASLREQGVTSIKLGNTSESYAELSDTASSTSAAILRSKTALALLRPYLLGSAVII